MDWLLQSLSMLFMLIGSVFVVVGAFGLIRMPDFYTRLHAASVTDTGGILFVVMGLMLQAVFFFDNPMAAIKLCLVVLFTYFTAPTASHAIAKAALMAKIIPQCPNGRLAVDQSLPEYHSEAISQAEKRNKRGNQ